MERTIKRFLKSNPYPVKKHVDESTHTYRFDMQVRREPPKIELGLLIGDCVHNMRAAIDHVAWSLATAHSGEDLDDKDTLFPIALDPSKFRNARHRIARMSPRARALVRWLQPFRRPEPERVALAALHALDIVDKHKLNAVTAALMRESSINISDQGWVQCEPQTHWRIGAVADGATLLEVELRDLRPAPNAPRGWVPRMDVKAKFPIDLVFGHEVPVLNGQPITDTLKLMRASVDRIISLVDCFADRLI